MARGGLTHEGLGAPPFRRPCLGNDTPNAACQGTSHWDDTLVDSTL